MIYAKNTNVSVEKSEGEIKALLIRYGANSFASAWQNNKALIRFQAQNRMIQFILPLPDPKEDRFIYRVWGKKIDKENLRSEVDAHKEWEQACRQRWRALALAIKAKLEAVESEITTFEEEFYSHIVMPGGKTLYEMTGKQVGLAYETRKTPQLLDYK